MEQQHEDMNVSHDEALEIDAKAGRVRQAVEDLSGVALYCQETVDGVLLQPRPSISWDAVSQRLFSQIVLASFALARKCGLSRASFC
jgi:hypothetical protein